MVIPFYMPISNTRNFQLYIITTNIRSGRHHFPGVYITHNVGATEGNKMMLQYV